MESKDNMENSNKKQGNWGTRLMAGMERILGALLMGRPLIRILMALPLIVWLLLARFNSKILSELNSITLAISIYGIFLASVFFGYMFIHLFWGIASYFKEGRDMAEEIHRHRFQKRMADEAYENARTQMKEILKGLKDGVDPIKRQTSLSLHPYSVWCRIVVAVLLFWSLADHAYGYYTFLRWITCGVAAYFAYIAYEGKKNIWVWILGSMALIFNPIIPFRLDRGTWGLIDLISGILILLSLFFVKQFAKAKYTEEDAIIDLVVENEKELEDITDEDITAKMKEKTSPQGGTAE